MNMSQLRAGVARSRRVAALRARQVPYRYPMRRCAPKSPGLIEPAREAVTLRVSEAVIRLLEAHDVDVIFGIPGVHTIELYRGLAG